MLVQINEKDVYKVGVSYGWCDLVNKYIENKIKNEFNRCGNDAIVYERIEPKKEVNEKKKNVKWNVWINGWWWCKRKKTQSQIAKKIKKNKSKK